MICQQTNHHHKTPHIQNLRMVRDKGKDGPTFDGDTNDTVIDMYVQCWVDSQQGETTLEGRTCHL